MVLIANHKYIYFYAEYFKNLQKNPENSSRFFAIPELYLKYDFLFLAVIFCTIITFSTFKRFDIVRKPRPSGILQEKIFWKIKILKLKKKILKILNFLCKTITVCKF